MNYPLRKTIFYLLVLSIFTTACQTKKENENIVSDNKELSLDPEKEEIKSTVEDLLFAAGNYDLEVLEEMVMENTNLGITVLKEGEWHNSVVTIDEYFEGVRNRNPLPYCEIVNDYNIMLSEGQLALVRADAIVHRFGIPQAREINHFTLLKENGDWKFLNISFTVNPIAKEKKYLT